jgi:hypothetical protein
MNLLKSKGIEFDGNELLLNGEVVGHLWETVLVISNEIPSLYNRLYAEMEKTRIGLSSADAQEAISKAVKCLKSSPVRYEKTLKEMRISYIRDYFNRRKYAVNEIEQFMLAEMC